MVTEATRNSEIQEILRDSAEVLKGTKDEVVTIAKDSDLPLGQDDGMVARTVSSAGIVHIWDSKTFEKIPVLYYMLQQKIRERRPDGSWRFTTKEPIGKPWKGIAKCLLHKDDPDAEYYHKELGLRYCRKENLANVYERNRHMKMKHPKEWEAIESARTTKERLEDRELQRAYLRAIGEHSGVKNEIEPERELYVSDKDKKKLTPTKS